MNLLVYVFIINATKTCINVNNLPAKRKQLFGHTRAHCHFFIIYNECLSAICARNFPEPNYIYTSAF